MEIYKTQGLADLLEMVAEDHECLNVIFYLFLKFFFGLLLLYRVQDVAELLGMMVEDHKRLQPNVKTYA